MRRLNYRRSNSIKNILNSAAAILCLLPVLLSFLYVFLFGVNLPFKDDWDIEVYCLERYHSGELSFSDLFKAHNEHRMFFPRISMIILALLTEYSTKGEMYFIQFLFLMSLLIIFPVFKSQFGGKSIPLTFVLIVFLLFSPRQYENMLMGCQISFIFAFFFSLFTFYLLHIKGRKSSEVAGGLHLYFISSLMTATVSSFSAAMGLLVWPAGLLQIFLIPLKKNKKIFYSLIWFITGFMEWAIYFTVNYNKPEGHPDVFNLLYKPFMFLLYFFTCLGNSLSWDKITSPLIGTVIFLILFLSLFLLYKNKRIQENSFWITMAAYSLFIVLSISIGRSGFTTEQALVSRYTTFTIPFLIGLYAILIDLKNYKKSFSVKCLYSFLVFIMIFGLFFSYKCGVDEGIRIKKERDYLAAALLNYKEASDEDLGRIYPVPEEVRQSSSFLEEYNYSLFSK